MKRELKYRDFPPLFLGRYPLTLGVQVICACHFLLCLCFISTASSVVAVRFWDLEVSPEVQVLAAAWHLLGVFFIAAAVVATQWRQALPLRAYFWYLVAAAASWLVWTVQLFQEGAICAFVTKDRQSQRVGISVSCGLVSACWELWAVTVLLCALYACYSVWHLAEFIAERADSEHLFEEEEPFAKQAREGKDLGLHTAIEETASVVGSLRHGSRPHAAEAHPATWAVPSPGTQPTWGSMHIRTASFT